MPCSGSQDWGIYLFHFGLTHVAYAVSRMHVLSHDLYQQPLLPTVPLFMHDLWFAVSFFHFHGELNWATLVPRFFPTELTSFSFRIADGCRLCLHSDFWVREWSFWARFLCWVIIQFWRMLLPMAIYNCFFSRCNAYISFGITCADWWGSFFPRPSLRLERIELDTADSDNLSRSWSYPRP